jgi:hypothetical protein
MRAQSWKDVKIGEWERLLCLGSADHAVNTACNFKQAGSGLRIQTSMKELPMRVCGQLMNHKIALILVMGAGLSCAAAVPMNEQSAKSMEQQSPTGDAAPARQRWDPIPADGAVPPIWGLAEPIPYREYEHRAKFRTYRAQIRSIRREFFQMRGESQRVVDRRAAGIEQLCEFTDPAAFRPMIEELTDTHDTVQLAVLDHFAACDDPGQGALAWTAIHHPDAAIRNEATMRITQPPAQGVLCELDQGLRSSVHATANHAGTLAGALNVIDAIPLLLFGQVTVDEIERDGDLAWIAIQTQRVYVQNVTPVTGSGSGAFQPVLGILNEGSVLRVMDAVAVFYRTEIHTALVNMTSAELGESTAEMGYDPRAWWQWYNTQFIAHMQEKELLEALERQAASSQPAP